MVYDRQGRLKSEVIRYVKSKGVINYEYQGDNFVLKQAVCEDNFFDNNKKFVLFRPIEQ